MTKHTKSVGVGSSGPGGGAAAPSSGSRPDDVLTYQDALRIARARVDAEKHAEACADHHAECENVYRNPDDRAVQLDEAEPPPLEFPGWATWAFSLVGFGMFQVLVWYNVGLAGWDALSVITGVGLTLGVGLIITVLILTVAGSRADRAMSDATRRRFHPGRKGVE